MKAGVTTEIHFVRVEFSGFAASGFYENVGALDNDFVIGLFPEHTMPGLDGGFPQVKLQGVVIQEGIESVTKVCCGDYQAGVS